MLWTFVSLCSATAIKFITGGKKKKEEIDTIKMLTQDGQLVEIDKTLLAATGQKISHDDIHDWIKK